MESKKMVQKNLIYKSFFCTADTNTFLINYISIKKLKIKIIWKPRGSNQSIQNLRT